MLVNGLYKYGHFCWYLMAIQLHVCHFSIRVWYKLINDRNSGKYLIQKTGCKMIKTRRPTKYLLVGFLLSVALSAWYSIIYLNYENIMIRCLVHCIFFVPANSGRPLDRQGKISENNRHHMFIYIEPARSILDFG